MQLYCQWTNGAYRAFFEDINIFLDVADVKGIVIQTNSRTGS